MTANVGTTDRLIRFILGIVFFVLAFGVALSPAWKWIFIILGVILFGTALFRFCALYPIFKINTARKE